MTTPTKCILWAGKKAFIEFSLLSQNIIKTKISQNKKWEQQLFGQILIASITSHELFGQILIASITSHEHNTAQ